MDEQVPLVSIVTATYNRSNMLRYAILSAIEQTFTNWELLVIGDCCTDNTEEVVNSFNDDRISFFNLPENFGEQSGPNNEGVRRARGKYIAFLNHDDIYLADHLELLVNLIEDSGADMVYSMGLRLDPPHNELLGASSDGKFHPEIAVPATNWLCRKELFDTVGPWRSFKQTFNQPSQDWLYRCWKAGKDMHGLQTFSTLNPRNGARPIEYSKAGNPEEIYEFAKPPEKCRQQVFKELALKGANYRNALPVWGAFRTGLRSMAFKFARLIGVAPFAMRNFFRFGRKKGYINNLRKKRGLVQK